MNWHGENYRRGTPAERFFRKIQILSDGCWLWLGYIRPDGYGSITISVGKRMPAHRFAYQEIVGEIPPGLDLDHLCHNRWCVNPRHLEAVTRRENILRGVGKNAIVHQTNMCMRGHMLTPDNTYYVKSGRQCRQCAHDRQQQRLPARRERYHQDEEYRQRILSYSKKARDKKREQREDART